MKRLIYQYWSGEMPTYAQVSSELFRSYAEKYEADYLFEQDPNFFRSSYSRYYNALRPIFDKSFYEYDQVLFVDMDVIPLLGNDANIFDIHIGHVGMVEEVDQPQYRSNMRGNITTTNDQRWAQAVKLFWGVQVPRDSLDRPRVFNSGVVLYTNAGMRFAKRHFSSVRSYQYLMTLAGLPRFYRLDQNYLGAFIGKSGCEFSILHSDWNSQVTNATAKNGESILIDQRTSTSKFIHMQHSKGIKNKMTREEVLSVANGTYQF